MPPHPPRDPPAGLLEPTPRRGLLGDILRTLYVYVRGQLLISLAMTVLYGVGFFLAGVPLWWLAAVLCGIFHWIPVLGLMVAVTIPLLFLLIGGGRFEQFIWVLLVFGVVQMLESFYLTPKILGAELKLNPLFVFAAILAGALLFGPLGALLAAPLVAVLILVWKRNRGPGR